VHQTAEFNITEHKIFLRGSMPPNPPTETEVQSFYLKSCEKHIHIHNFINYNQYNQSLVPAEEWPLTRCMTNTEDRAKQKKLITN